MTPPTASDNLSAADAVTARTSRPRGKVHFADEAARALLEGHLAELCRPAEAGWERFKRNTSRTVYRGRIDGQDIYLKHYHGRSLLHWLKRHMGRHHSMREMRFSQLLNSHGVPAVPMLATMWGRHFEWLASKAVAPSEPADRWQLAQLARGAAGRVAIRQAIAEMGRLVGRMHAAGVIHRDLHCGNILVRTDTPTPQLVLTDLHRVSRRRRLSRRERSANLAQLFHDRRDFTTRTDRLWFLRHYLAAGGGGSLRGWNAMIEHFASRHTRRQFSQRDRRIFATNRYFAPVRLAGGWRGHVVLATKQHMAGSRAAEMEFTAEEWLEALRDPDSLFSGPGVEVVKKSPSGIVIRRRLAVGGKTLDVFIKRPRRKHAWKVVLDCFRPARPIRAFRLGHTLLTRRIPTALPLVAIERRIGPILTDSILVTEAVESVHLNQFLNTWFAAAPPAAESEPAPGAPRTLPPAQQRQLAREVLWQLGRLLQRLHDNNFAHRDLKATNILVRWSPGQEPELVLIDLDGLKQLRRITARRQFQGLMRLNVSLLECPVVNHAGRLRMLLGYLRRPGSGRINFKPYWRVLEKWSAKKLRQQIRSRRRRQRAARRPS